MFGSILLKCVNQANETNYMFFYWVFEHDDNHYKLMNANLKFMDGHFFIKPLLSFFMKWNSIKDSCEGINLTLQVDKLFKKVQISNSTSG